MYTFEDFVNIIAELRSDHGCPWDREQTFESLKKCLADEAEEVFQAVDHKDLDNQVIAKLATLVRNLESKQGRIRALHQFWNEM